MRRLAFALLAFALPALAQDVRIESAGGGLSGTVTTNTLAKGSSGALADSQCTDDGTIVTCATANVFASSIANDSSRNLFHITGTMPTTPTGQVDGIFFDVTSAGSTNATNSAMRLTYEAGYTGVNVTNALAVRNQVAGTGSDLANNLLNIGVGGTTSSTTTGTNVGVLGNVAGGDRVIGVMGKATGSKNSATNIGGAFYGLNGGTTPIFIGVYADLVNGSTAGATQSAAIVANNNTQAVAIFIAEDAGTKVFAIGDGGDVQLNRTITAGGTTGAQTINKTAGTVNFAAAATTLVVTNSLVTTSSIVFAVVRTNDSTATIKNVVPASGSFTITLTAAATAETSVGFFVTD